MSIELTGEYHTDCNLLLGRVKVLESQCFGVELNKLEVGRTYVFKDEVSKSRYLNHYRANKYFFSNYYKDGFTVSTVTDEGDGCYEDGNTVILVDEIRYFKLKEENVMPIKPEDKITLEFSYSELAVIYAFIGKMRYGVVGSLWEKLKPILDADDRTHSQRMLSKKSLEDVIDYRYKSAWESLLFPQKPVETQQQIQIRELREQAETLLQKAKELEGTK